MKTTLVVLVVSLLGNAALLALVLRSETSLAERDLTVAAERRTDTSPDARHQATAADDRLPAQQTGAGPLWSKLASDDPRTLMQRLQNAGFPPTVIRTIVFEMLQRRVQERTRALNGDPATRPYWQPRFTQPSPEISRELSAAWTAHQSQLRELFGIEYHSENGADVTRLRLRFGVSDPQKLARLLSILDDYQQVQNETFQDSRGAAREFMQESQQMIKREQLADIAAILTPEEFAEYELRASDSAQALRASLRDFQPSEAEYRALFAVAHATKDPNGRAVDNGKLLEQARSILPPARLADLQQALAPGASKLNRLAARLDLPLSALTPVDTAQRELKQRAQTIRRVTSLTPEQRGAQLAAIADEATQKITATLGERGFAAYRDYDGAWIGELTTVTEASRP